MPHWRCRQMSGNRCAAAREVPGGRSACCHTRLHHEPWRLPKSAIQLSKSQMWECAIPARRSTDQVRNRRRITRYPYSASNRLFQLKGSYFFSDGQFSAAMYEVHTVHYTKEFNLIAAWNSIQSTFIRSEIGEIKRQCRSHSDREELALARGVPIYGTAGRSLAPAARSLPAVICSVVRDSRIPRVNAMMTGRPVASSTLRMRLAERG